MNLSKRSGEKENINFDSIDIEEPENPSNNVSENPKSNNLNINFESIDIEEPSYNEPPKEEEKPKKIRIKKTITKK
jgi:hypothetical protein